MGNSGFNFFVNAFNVTPAGLGSWEDVDVSSYLPAGATGVILEFSDRDQSIPRKHMARKKGSTDNFVTRTEATTVSGHVYFLCGVDANRVFQAYVETVDCEIWLIGYTDSAVAFFADGNAIEYSPSAPGIWKDQNIADKVSNDATGVIGFWLTKEGASQYEGIIRKKGSTDYLIKNVIRGPVGALCGLSASKIFQNRVSHLDLEFWVIGYTKPPVTFFTNYIVKGPPTVESEWEELDVSSIVGPGVGGVILELRFQQASVQSIRIVVRRKGSSDNRVVWDDRVRYNGHIWALVGIDAEGILETFVEKDHVDQDINNVKFHVVGYVKWEGILKTKFEKVSLEAA